MHLQIVKLQWRIADLAHTVFAPVTLLLFSAFIFLLTCNAIALAFALLHSIDHLVGDARFLPLCIHSCVAGVLLLNLKLNLLDLHLVENLGLGCELKLS